MRAVPRELLIHFVSVSAWFECSPHGGTSKVAPVDKEPKQENRADGKTGAEVSLTSLGASPNEEKTRTNQDH